MRALFASKNIYLAILGFIFSLNSIFNRQYSLNNAKILVFLQDYSKKLQKNTEKLLKNVKYCVKI